VILASDLILTLQVRVDIFGSSETAFCYLTRGKDFGALIQNNG
jgi:hypothetical protein